MDIKQIYREETDLEVYTVPNPDSGWCFSAEYVKWLESKIKHNGCSLQLKDKKELTFEEWIVLNRYTAKAKRYVDSDGFIFDKHKLIKKYNEEVMSL